MSERIEIEYIKEEFPLGTAGSLSLITEFQTQHILLMNSDLLTNIDFNKMYLSLINSHSDMVIASKEYKVDIPYAVFESEKNNVIDFKEKPTYIFHSNAGIYMFKKEIVNRIPKNKFYDITDLISELINTASVRHYPIRGFWIDIGNPTDYDNANELMKSQNYE